MTECTTTNDKRIQELLSHLDIKDHCAHLTIEFLPEDLVKVYAKLYMTSDGMDKLVEIFKEGKIVDKETLNALHK